MNPRCTHEYGRFHLMLYADTERATVFTACVACKAILERTPWLPLNS